MVHKNSFLALGGEEENNHDNNFDKLSNKQLKKLKRKQNVADNTLIIMTTPQTTENLRRVYNLPEIWMVILEFLPTPDLLINCSSLNRYHHDLIHSVNCYASILIRDFIEYSIIPKSVLKGIFINDYKRMLSKIVNNTVRIMKFNEKMIDCKVNSATVALVKKSFRNIYIELSETMRTFLDGAQNLSRSEHVHYFMEERLDRIDLPPSFSLVGNLENKADHSKTQKDKHTFRMTRRVLNSKKLFCLSCNCGLQVVLSDSPFNLFVQPELRKNRKIKTLYSMKVQFQVVLDPYKPICEENLLDLSDKTI